MGVLAHLQVCLGQERTVMHSLSCFDVWKKKIAIIITMIMMMIIMMMLVELTCSLQ